LAAGVTTHPVNWFEIPVTDLGRARDFYERVLGTSLEVMNLGGLKMAWFPRPENAPGTSGGLIEAPGRTPSRAGTMVFFTVPDIDATLRAIAANGGKIVMPKTGGGEHGAVAQFEDSEGNLVALFSNRAE
jgi:uncharacterized protein